MWLGTRSASGTPIPRASMMVSEILVQREASHASGNPLEPDAMLELLFQVDAVLQGIRTGKGIDPG